MDIKEIALKVARNMAWALEVPSLRVKAETIEHFAEALIAELAKQNEPCAFLHEWIEYHPFGDTFAGEPCSTITNDEKPFDSSDTVSPLFTFPPTAEQIANETAEVIAEYCRNQDHYCLATEIENGAWKEFKK